MNKALDAGDFALAIELCADCQNDVEKYKHYHSVGDLGTKYADAMESISDRLEAALRESARKFNPKTYESALIGFKLRGKPHKVLEVLLTYLSDLVDLVSHECAVASVVAIGSRTDPTLRAERVQSSVCQLARAWRPHPGPPVAYPTWPGAVAVAACSTAPPGNRSRTCA